jgi:hypothetical protein
MAASLLTVLTIGRSNRAAVGRRIGNGIPDPEKHLNESYAVTRGFARVRNRGLDLRIFLSRLLLPIALFAAGSAASAQGLSQTVYVGGDISLPVPVTASVGGICAFATGEAPAGSYDAGAIDTTAWTHDFEFTIECNTASRVAVVSANGGLKNATSVTDLGYANLAPYTVALNLDGDATSASASCAAATLLATASSPCSFLGPASTTAGLRLTGPSDDETDSYLRVSAPAYPGPDALITGNYSDTLIITIAAAP